MSPQDKSSRQSRAQLSGFNSPSTQFCMSPQDKSSRQSRAQLSGFNILSTQFCMLPQDKNSRAQLFGFNIPSTQSSACHLKTKELQAEREKKKEADSVTEIILNSN